MDILQLGLKQTIKLWAPLSFWYIQNSVKEDKGGQFKTPKDHYTCFWAMMLYLWKWAIWNNKQFNINDDFYNTASMLVKKLISPLLWNQSSFLSTRQGYSFILMKLFKKKLQSSEKNQSYQKA